MRIEPPARSRSCAGLLVLALACSRPAPGAPPGAGQAGAAPAGAEGVRGTRAARVVFPDGRTFLAEVADTPDERARGLMHRQRLPPGEGMVFLFDGPDIHSFWMKNTLVPLDIVWLDPEGRIVHLERSVRPCAADPCPSVVPLRPATWVLEVAAGQSQGLKPGERLLVAPEGGTSGAAPRTP